MMVQMSNDLKSKEENLQFITDRVKEYGGIKRLGHIFHTPKQAYFFDSGTGKVECLDESEEQFFKWLFERSEDSGYEQWNEYNSGKDDADILMRIKQGILQENLLKSPNPAPMRSLKHQSELKKRLEENVRMITLELTGRCNLRCRYCIYNEGYCENRNFSDNDMAEETAKKAIKYLAEHSGEDVAVTFYGGEPLLRFELIRTCVEYAKELMGDKNLSFSITSNMTLMTKEIAEYFHSIDKFSLVASIDGPKEIHDEYRKYPNGSGSFDDALRGLKILTEVYGEDFASCVSLSMVFTPPYTFARADRIHQFFEQLEWLPEKTEKLLSYPENGSVEYKLEEADGVFIDEETNKGYVDTINQWTKLNFKNDLEDKSGMFSKKLQEDLLLKVHKRPLVDKPAALYGLNGCCIPGTRRLYVTTKGEFLPCERIGSSPAIGNVDQGLSYEDIKRYYVEDYIKESEQECSQCWANKICGVCYAKTYTGKGISMDKKNFQCDMTRHNAVKSLVLYHTCLEENADSMQYLNDIQFG